uniref:NADH dehydrogenase [ubiquinone] 1 alpha subcomplex assembly factor 2 n=1 Tax=Timema poppense TaxID=170557 RepID=A0A7R9H9I3_TIMPO|nr:unnamed protein product [Timema poppensis]
MAQEGRSILAMIIRNFVNSLRPKQIKGDKIGKDYLGNNYFEIPPNPQIGKRRAERWFTPKNPENFEQEIPAEWEAWLRGRRNDPPLEEEVMRNFAISQLKKKNAAEIEAREKSSNPKDFEVVEKEIKGMESFPKYDEYEVMPGKPRVRNSQK